MRQHWWQKKSFWVFICVSFGLAIIKAKFHPFLTVIGIVLIALGIALTLVRNQGGDS